MSDVMTAASADFTLKIDFARGEGDPGRVFRAALKMIAALEAVDRSLAGAIDTRLQPTLVLDDIEAGSFLIKLRQVVEGIDDEALRKVDWKHQVGKYLVKGKYKLIELLNRSGDIAERKQIEDAAAEIGKMAVATDVLRLPSYQPPSAAQLVRHVEELSRAKSELGAKDRMSFETAEGSTVLDPTIEIPEGHFETVLTRDTIPSTRVMVLIVRRPDYLGTAQWDFRHGKRPIAARIEHVEWLTRFQSRQIDVRPGDALSARVRVETRYGFDNEVIDEYHIVEEVISVIRPPSQGSLL